MRRRLRRIRERRERRRQTPRANLRRFLASVRERGLDPRHVVDVGANVGRWTERALQAFPTCRITMLEPQVEMTRHLERLCAAHERARWIQAAVGKACGEAVLTVNDDPTSSSLAYSAEDAAAHGWERRVVPVVTLDHLAKAELKAIPEIVKLDAEGLELEILEGATSLLGTTEMFLLELALTRPRAGTPDFLESMQFMRDRGYVIYDFTEFVLRPSDGTLALCEAAFVREDGILRRDLGWD